MTSNGPSCGCCTPRPDPDRLPTGQSTAAASIREAMRTEGCRCEETNPKGSCCLGDITEALSRIQAHGPELHPG